MANLTQEEKQQIILNAISEGCSNKDACRMAGIDESLFYKWKKDKKHFQFFQSLKKAESEFISSHLKNINTAAKESWQASAWMLERKRPKEFGRNIAENKKDEKEALTPELIEKMKKEIFG